MIKQLYWKIGKALVYPLGLTQLMGTITSVRTSEPKLALTFDDGPDPKWTPLLLDILKAHGAKATFFVVGQLAEKYPWIVKRVLSEGHSICNHSWSHASMPQLSANEQRDQIKRCASLCEDEGPLLFRPPYGHQTIGSRWAAQRLSHRAVTWSGHIADWRQSSAEELRGRLMEQCVPGAIILLHDSILIGPGVQIGADLQGDRSALFEAVDLVLSEASGQFDFVTIPELLKSGDARYQNWFKKSYVVA